MTRWIAAAVCVCVTGLLGAFSLHQSQAQDGTEVLRPRVEFQPAQRARMTERPSQTSENTYLEILEDGAGSVQWPLAPIQGRGQPGTWQIVTSRDMTLLLNTASGETFVLAGDKESPRWKPVERPLPRLESPGFPPFPGMPDRPDTDQMRRTLDDLRKRAEKAEGRDREALKEKISALEKALKEGDRPAKPAAPRQPDNELAEMEALLRRAKDKIADLEGRVEKTDSKRETEELKRQLEDLRADAKKLANELEKARKEQKERDKRDDKDRDEG